MVEKALIDHYSLLGNNIANIQGTETEYHNIIFSGENIINVEEIYFKK